MSTESFEIRRAKWRAEAMVRHSAEMASQRTKHRYARLEAEKMLLREREEARRQETLSLKQVDPTHHRFATAAEAKEARLKLVYERLRERVVAKEITAEQAQRLFNMATRSP